MTEKRVKELLNLCNSISEAEGSSRWRGDKQVADILEMAQGAISELIRELEKTQPKTLADQIRSMTDEQLAEKIYKLVQQLQNETVNDMSVLYCDGKNNCITKTGNIRCNPKKEKSCVLRWLQRPVEEDDHGN